MRLIYAISIGCLAAACSPPPPGPSDGGAGHVSEALKACAQLQGPVLTIAQAVERLNALPRPVSVACFVASVARPLELVATTSTTSAQPSVSSKSPRIFILTPGVALSVAPDGEGKHLIEFGEWQTTKLTLKGEIELPLNAPLAANAPYTRVMQTNGTTTCSLCHRYENPHPSMNGGFVSAAYRPNPGTEVKHEALVTEHQACVDSGDTSERCELFHALFDFGATKQGAFSKEVELFF